VEQVVRGVVDARRMDESQDSDAGRGKSIYRESHPRVWLSGTIFPSSPSPQVLDR
jgi:hypothetical protein